MIHDNPFGNAATALDCELLVVYIVAHVSTIHQDQPLE